MPHVRRASVRALVLLAIVASASAASASGVASAMPSPFSVDDPFIADGLEAAKQKQDRDDSAAAKEEREQSRHRWAGASVAESLVLGRRFFPEAFAIDLFDGENPAPGLEIVDYQSRTTAIAESDDGERLMVQSSAPLRAQAVNGDMAAVDLSLRESTDTFTTTNSNADIQISKDVEDGTTLPGKDVTIAPLAAREAEGQQTDGRVFYPSIDTDTDYVVVPQPDGGEVGWLLRSAAAPERFVLSVDMPAGATLRRPHVENPIPNDPPRGLEVVKDGKVLVAIKAPIAYDADHSPVQTRLSILADDQIAMSVEHRDEDLHYPLYADPEVVMIMANNTYGWSGWGPAWYTHGAYYSTSTSGNVNFYGVGGYAANNGTGPYNPNGIYLSMPTNTTYWPRNTGVNWSYKAPAGAYIHRAIMGHVNLSPLPGSARYAYLYTGLMNPARSGWDAGQDWAARLNGTQYAAAAGIFGPNPDARAGWDFDHCYSRCNTALGSESNEAIFGLAAINNYNNNNIVTGTGSASITMNYAQIYLGDKHPPTMVTGTFPTDRDWRDDSAAHSYPYARDLGLGVKSITLSGVATGNGTVSNSCTGRSPLPADCVKWAPPVGFSYTLNEGINTPSLTPRDIIGNAGPPAKWTEKIDRSPPTVIASGGLRDLQFGIDDSGRDMYDLRVVATDGTPSSARVGVDDVVVNVDDAEVDRFSSDTACSDSCGVDETMYLDLDAYSEGVHTVSVEAVDRLGHPAPPITWTIDIPRKAFYTAKLAQWRSDVEQAVDDQDPTSELTGSMPAPANGWDDEGACEASADALRACYAAVRQWHQAVRAWLGANLLLDRTFASELPDPPTFEYALINDGTSVDLTRATRDAFTLAKVSLASPLAALNVAVTFNEAVSPAAVLSALPGLAAPAEAILSGVYGSGSGGLSGTMTSPTTAPLVEIIEDFYNQQIAIAQEDIAEVSAAPPADADEAAANQEFVSEHQAFVAGLQARQPFVTGVAARFDVTALLSVLLDADVSQMVKRIEILPDSLSLLGIGTSALSTATPNSAAVEAARSRRSASDGASAATDPQPRCYDLQQEGRVRAGVLDPTPTYWAPSRLSYNSSLGDPATGGGLHLKYHRLRWRWTDMESLAWMCADKPGERNVEIEASVYPDESDRWSNNWASREVRTFTQHNGPAGGTIHQDDIASGDPPDQIPPGYPYDKQAYPDFAILFQSSQEFRYKRLYKVRFVTNRGFTDSAKVMYTAQASFRATTLGQQIYCGTQSRRYQSCMFTGPTVCYDHAAINEPTLHKNVNWRTLMGSGATRIKTVESSNPSVVKKNKAQIVANCDPRP